MEEKDMGIDIELQKYDDYVIKKTLLKITRKELEKCINEEKVPSREVLDTINTLVNFHKVF